MELIYCSQSKKHTFFFGGSFGTKEPDDDPGGCLFLLSTLSSTCASLCGRSGGVCHDGAKYSVRVHVQATIRYRSCARSAMI